ncbi:unnamed protein product [Ceratitis capitata]|uniref:(Mediterranean fruit fly) hypothetical protein n=1 Tax=Ceratitis capitata TaxID=7213 RepID=A0A811VH07_CERCA|nr:unnamed protein product [Ceratitis capitata]
MRTDSVWSCTPYEVTLDVQRHLRILRQTHNFKATREGDICWDITAHPTTHDQLMQEVTDLNNRSLNFSAFRDLDTQTRTPVSRMCTRRAARRLEATKSASIEVKIQRD